MAPFLIGSIASSALDALTSSTTTTSSTSTPTPTDPFDALVQRLEQSGAGEKTVTKADGSTVTSVPTANGDQVVSETSANGQTLTEAGYVSPVLLNNFLSNLFGSLQATQTGVGGTTSLAASVQGLESKLQAGSASSSPVVQSFNNLMQSSGISLPSGTTASTALAQFLKHAAPAIEAGDITRQGIKVSA